MNRCALLAAAFVLGAAHLPLAAQVPRNFPATALRGEIVVTSPPELLLNKRPARLAPGARIRGTNNMLVMSGAAINRRLLVNYTLDIQGQLLDVWVLNQSEAARNPWPSTPQEAAAWTFNAAAQTWSRP